MLGNGASQNEHLGSVSSLSSSSAKEKKQNG